MRTRLVPYVPFGGRLAAVPDALESQVVSPLGDQLPTASVHYPRAGVNAGALDGVVELGFEFWNGSAWVEPPNCRYLAMKGSRDHLEDVPTQKYEFTGIGWLLRRAKVWEAAGLPVDEDGKVQFNSATAGQVMGTLITNAQRRGWAPGVRVDFTAGKDSAGKAWAKVLTIAYDVDVDLDTVLVNLYRQGVADYRWEGRTLRIFNADTAMGRDLSGGASPLRLLVADGQTSAPEDWTNEDRLTDAMVLGEDGKRWNFNNGSKSPLGRMESVITQGGVSDEGTAAMLAEPDLLAGVGTRFSYTREFGVTPETLRWPFRDFGPGDWVQAQRGTAFERLRVQSVSLTVNADGVKGHAVLGDKLEDLLTKLAKRTKGITGGASAGGSGVRPAPEGPDRRKPAAPAGLTVGARAYIDGSGQPQGRVELGWSHSGKATNGTAMRVDRFQVYYRINETGKPWKLLVSVDDTELDFSPLPIFKADGVTREEYGFKVRAVGENSAGSAFSNTVAVEMEDDTTPPPVPEFRPADLTTWLRTVTVNWSGMGIVSGQRVDMPRDSRGVRVYQGSSATGPWVRVGASLESGLVHQTGSMPLAKVWYALTSVDSSGNESERSAVQSVTPAQLVDVEEIIGEIDAGKVEIKNAGRLILESGVQLHEKLAGADKAIADTNEALTGPGGLTERIAGAETKLGDVGALVYADGQTLRQKLAAADTAIKNTGEELGELRETTIPALDSALADADKRLDAADKLLTDTFPKRIEAAEGAATAAQTKAAAAETAATKAAADLVTAKTRADSAAAAAVQAAADAEAAERASTRATGAAGAAEAAADEAAAQAAAALEQAQNAGGDVGAAQAAAKAAQAAADVSKAQAAAAGTSAAAADAKAAQAAADAAQAAADALASQKQATKSAGEATTAKQEAAAAATRAAAAETAAATAKTRADTAAANASTAAGKATAAETAATKASGAAGVAEAAADEAAKDATAALTQAKNSGSNATAAQTAATAAQTAANTAKAQAAAAGTSAAAADAAAAQAAADAAQAAADLVVAKNAAADARGDADTALDRADSAIKAAGSAARVLYSTGNPSGTAREGDTWRKTNGAAGDVVAEWRYTVTSGKGTWTPQKVTSEMVSNLDVGKLSAGSAGISELVAEKIAAGTASFQRVDAKNLFVSGKSSLSEVVAKRLAAETGSFLELGVDQLTVSGTANLKTAVADRLFANIFATNKLTTNELMVGKGENLIPWLVNAPSDSRTVEPHVAVPPAPALGLDGGTTGMVGAHALTNNQSVTPGTYTNTIQLRSGYKSANLPAGVFEVLPNTKYKLSVWIRAGGSYGTYPDIRLNVGLYDATGKYVNGPWFSEARRITWNWEELTYEFTTSPTHSGATIFVQMNQPGVIRIDQPMLVRDGASLIATGGIVADHITASEEMSAKMGKFLKLDVGDLVATGSAKLNEAVVTKLWSDVVRSRMITTDMLLVGKGTNLIPNGDFANGLEGWNPGFGIYRGDPAAVRLGYPASIWLAGNKSLSTSATFSVKGGQKYQFSMWARANTTGKRFYVQLQTEESEANNLQLVANQLTYTGSFRQYEAEFTAPEGATAATLRIYANHVNGSTTDGHQWFTGFELYEKNGASLIVDGGIVTKHLKVTEDMTVALLKAHKVKAGEIDTNSLTADSGFVGALEAKIITSNVFSGKLFSGGTFTGSIFRTHTAGSTGVQLDSWGLRAWNSAKVQSFSLSASTGDVSIVDGKFTGGMFQTKAAAGRGIKLSEAGLASYSSGGKLTFLLDGQEGDAQFDSRVRFGGKETPSWVVVPWESKTSERAGIWLVNGGSAGIGGTETAGMFMDNSNATFANVMNIRGMNGGGVKAWGRFQSDDMYSGTIHHAGGLYRLQGANGSYFQRQVIFNGRIQYAGAPSTSSSANAHIATDGTIWKSSSAARFKVDPRPSELPDSLLGLDFKDWLDKGQLDLYASIVSGAQPITENESKQLQAAYLGRVGGVIAEDVEAAAGDAARLFVTYDKEGRLETVNYDRLGVALALKLARKVDELAAELAELKGKA